MASGISSTKEQAGHGSPFVSFSTVFNNYFLPDALPDLMDTSIKEQETYSIKKGDILITRTSETIDELAMSCVAVKDYPRATYSGFTKRLRPKTAGIAYHKYLAFYLRSQLFRKAVTNNAFMTLRASFNEDTPAHTVTPVQAQQIVETVKQKVAEDKDLGQTFKENEMPLAAWMLYQTEETHRAAVNKFIPIPRIKVTDAGVEEYVFVDFDLDMADFTHVPIKNELLVQNLEDMQDRQRIKGDAIDFEGYNPKKVILEQLRQKPEIDYEKCSKLLFKLITQVCDRYEIQYGTNGMQNIIMMYKRDIGNKIYTQMLQHFYCENGFLQEEVVGTRDYNLQQSYSCAERVNLFSDDYTGNIQSVLFEGVKRGVFSAAKFDSRPELVLARVLETDTDVQNWLRPAPQEFNITYNHGHNYEPDFVVETDDTVYLVEVKGEDKLSDPDVIAKKRRGIHYCEVASRWGKANGYKQWKYLFIPSKQIMPNSSFMQLAKMFQTM